MPKARPKSAIPRFIRFESQYQMGSLESAVTDKQRRAYHTTPERPKFTTYAISQNSQLMWYASDIKGYINVKLYFSPLECIELAPKYRSSGRLSLVPPSYGLNSAQKSRKRCEYVFCLRRKRIWKHNEGCANNTIRYLNICEIKKFAKQSAQWVKSNLYSQICITLVKPPIYSKKLL